MDAGRGRRWRSTDTIIPVEPDEALAALKEFLDSLDPEGHRPPRHQPRGGPARQRRGPQRHASARSPSVVDDLRREGRRAGSHRRQLRSADRHPRHPRAAARRGARRLRRGEPGAGRRAGQHRAAWSAGLADLSADGPARWWASTPRDLRTDIQTLTDAAAIIDANLSSVSQLLDAGGPARHGPRSAPTTPPARSINLRNNFSPADPRAHRAAPRPARRARRSACRCSPPAAWPVRPRASRRRPASPRRTTPIGSLLDPARAAHRAARGPRRRSSLERASAAGSTTPPTRCWGWAREARARARRVLVARPRLAAGCTPARAASRAPWS